MRSAPARQSSRRPWFASADWTLRLALPHAQTTLTASASRQAEQTPPGFGAELWQRKRSSVSRKTGQHAADLKRWRLITCFGVAFQPSTHHVLHKYFSWELPQ